MSSFSYSTGRATRTPRPRRVTTCATPRRHSKSCQYQDENETALANIRIALPRWDSLGIVPHPLVRRGRRGEPTRRDRVRSVSQGGDDGDEVVRVRLAPADWAGARAGDAGGRGVPWVPRVGRPLGQARAAR